MDLPEHRAAVLDALNTAIATDRTRLTVNGFTHLGLVEMTRKRTRESLGPHPLRAMPHLQWPRRDQDRANRLLRNPARSDA